MFNDSKYTKWYFYLIASRINENRVRLKRTDPGFVYYERHHIVPSSLGGPDIDDNRVLLTAREHFICHYLLCKMTGDKDRSKMISAIVRMSFNNKHRKIPSRFYDVIRRLIGERFHFSLTGVKKSESHRVNISKARTGMKFSSDHIRNIGLAAKANNFKWITNGNESKCVKFEIAKSFLGENPEWRFGRTLTSVHKKNILKGKSKVGKEKAPFGLQLEGAETERL